MTRTAINLAKVTVSVLCLSSLYSQTGLAENSPPSPSGPNSQNTCKMTPIPGCHNSFVNKEQQEPQQTPTGWEPGNNPWDNVPQDLHRIEIKKGWQIPNTLTWVKLGGMFKFDGVHNVGTPTGDPFEAPFIFPKTSVASRMTGGTKFLVRQSNISISTITESRIGEIKTYLEADFATPNYYGSYANRQYFSLNSIGLRLREVYVETHGFLFGQTATTFSDKESNGFTLIHNGPSGNSQLRLPMVRYTWYDPFLVPDKGSTRLMIAAESPTTDYIQYNGPTNVFGQPLLNGQPVSLQQVVPLETDILVVPANRGVAPLPNLTAQLRFEKKGLGHIAFRALGRYLEVRPDKVTTVKDVGWGLGVSSRLFVTETDSLFFNYSAGRGIGYYIFDLPNQTLAYNSLTKTHQVQFGQGIIVGFEHYWTEHLRSNFIAGISQVNNARFLKTLAAGRQSLNFDNVVTDNVGVYGTDVAFVNRRIQTFIVNLMYKPTTALEFGVEYTHARRTSINGQDGIGKRFQISCIYRF
jgi:hypothetical protein